MQLGPYRYEKASLSVEPNSAPTIRFHDVHNSHVKSLVVFFRAFAIYYRNEMNTVKWSEECNATDSSTNDAVAGEGRPKSREKRFEVTFETGVTVLVLYHSLG